MGTRVLVADDSAVVLARVTRALVDAGLSALTAGSMQEALALNTSEVGAALLDIDLGDGWGPALAERLRERMPTLPIAFFSGGAHPTIVAEAGRIGRVFQKPDDLDAAVRYVATLVGEPRGIRG
jgi:DNA-binding NtrC family response regulator